MKCRKRRSGAGASFRPLKWRRLYWWSRRRLRPDHCARHSTLWYCSRGHKNESSSDLNISSSITRLLCSLIRLMPPSLTTLQCLLPGGCHLSRAGLQVPLASCKEFPHLIMSLFPFFLNCTLVLYVGSDISQNPYRCSCSADRSAGPTGSAFHKE
jgi:hypothetical protein